MNRKLATVEYIKKLEPIEGADAIEVATIRGWHVVVKKGEFSEGSPCIFFEVDSLLPVLPQFDFLASRGTKKMLVDGKTIEGYRLKTIKLRGQISQGLALPTHAFSSMLETQENWEVGTDVTEKLGVVKYEPPIPAQLAGMMRGSFPSFIPKTDEERIQNCEFVLEKYGNVNFYVAEKLDGTSCTVYMKDGELHVCSRNLDLKETEGNTYWNIARAYELEDVLKKLNEKGKNYALQGEIIGEGIQSNYLKIKGQRFYVFSVYDIDAGRYLDYVDFMGVCIAYGLAAVPIRDTKFALNLMDSVDRIVADSRRRSEINKEVWAEGYVWRPEKELHDETLGRVSFKAINPWFLLKYEN